MSLLILGDNQSLKHIGELSEANLFIDDTPANIKTAKGLGWHGINYMNYDQVVKELHDLGVRY